MEVKIYQINMDRDENRVCFMGLDSLPRFQGTEQIDSSIYNLVFAGDVPCSDLEGVYRMFNIDHPDRYTGRSLSVSDVVQIQDGSKNGPTFHYCDSIGFKEVQFVPELTQDALLFIRGERPVMDLKYDLTKHPNFKLTPEGGGKPYIHGEDRRSFAGISIDQTLLDQAQEWEIDTTSFVLLSEEELEESFTKKEKENHETVQENRKGPHRKTPRPRQG